MPPDHSYSSNPALQILSGSRALLTVSIGLIIIAVSACRDVGPAFGPTIPAARANADGLFGGIAQRFTNVQRNPKFALARGKLGKNALTPSAIFNDTSVWTGMGTDTRTVTVEGGFANNRYLFAAKPNAAAPDAAGDSRHLMSLRRLNDDDFE